MLHQGRYLNLKSVDGWEYASREGATGVVAILAVTEARDILLVEQERPALGKKVLELPAGLAGDDPTKPDEPLLSAAKRELNEETGYDAKKWWSLLDGPSSAGLTDEWITFFLATELTKVRDVSLYGVGRERIKLHVVPVAEAIDFAERRRRDEGVAVDFKIHAALMAARRHAMFPG